MSFIDELFKFALLLLTTCQSILNTRSLAALVITKNIFLARSLRVAYSILWSRVSSQLENLATSLYHKLSVALNFFLMSLLHALSQHSVTRTKNFLSRVRSTPSSTRARPAPARIALLVPAPGLQMRVPARHIPCMDSKLNRSQALFFKSSLWPGIETSLPALVMHVQPIVPLSALENFETPKYITSTQKSKNYHRCVCTEKYAT